MEDPAVAGAIRRSLTLDMDVAAGTEITASMLEIKRPGTGIQPLDIDKVIGMKAARDIKSDETLTWDLLVKR